MLSKIINERLEQLINRLKVIATNHKEYHTKCFEDGGDYYQLKELRMKFYEAGEVGTKPIDWQDSEPNKYLEKSGYIIDMLRQEILAINYYNAVRGGKNVFNLINNTVDTINNYGYLGVDIETNNLYPNKLGITK